MNIHNAGADYSCDKDFHLCRPNGSGDYLFVMFKTISTVLIGSERIAADPDYFILYEKGKQQDYCACGNTFSHDFVQFDFDDQSELLLIEGVPMNTLIKSPNPQAITNACRQITLEFFSNSKYKSALLSRLGQFFLLKVKEQTDGFLKKERPNRYLDALLSVRSEIYRCPQNKWTIAVLAQKISLSASYFQGLYVKTFGISCFEDVIRARINLAKQYLEYSENTITKIAHICGYDNEVHFMRQFKAQTGVSPKKFRTMHR